MKTQIPKISDDIILDLMFRRIFSSEEIRPEMRLHSISIELCDRINKSYIRDMPDDNSDFEKILENLLASKSKIITKIEAITVANEIKVAYRRTTDPIYDEIYLEFHDGYPTPYSPTPNDIAFFSNLQEIALQLAGSNNESWQVDPKRLNASHEVLTHLQKLSADIIQAQLDHHARLEDEKAKFLSEQRASFSQEAIRLEEQFAERKLALNEDFEIKDRKLADRESAINNADNTTARRKTTKQVLEEVQSRAARFEFSQSVSLRSRLIIVILVTLAAAGIINMLIGGFQITNLLNPNVTYDSSPAREPNQWLVSLALIKILGGTFLFLSTMLYLIKWQNQWTNRIAAIELEYQKFSRDLSRADLTIEMCLEWNEKKEGKIPEILLQAMTENLFKESQGQKPEEILHPAEHLAAAMLKSAERIEFPLGSASIATSGKRLKQASKSSASSQ